MHPIEFFAVVEVGVVAGGEEAFGAGDFKAEGVVVGGVKQGVGRGCWRG